ncbi:MAG: carboxylating nicotinate-nucleotide diphosphorylase [Gammaproteobacteria bacterium]|nr:carboxylating nicotinate-nucleotide diphosphorylase [Gammaproteobacteria bacterium]
MAFNPSTLERVVQADVARALQEDLGDRGDLTAALVPVDATMQGQVISREPGVLAGRPWFDESFRQLDPDLVIRWHAEEGSRLQPDQLLCTLHGLARPLLSGERTALNFLQTLSGTATITQHYAAQITGLPTVLLDTRKTLPGLRHAQKYAVRCGGGQNHRQGLYDAVLIKENHIAACGSIAAALRAAVETCPANIPIEIEVESLAELEQALESGATAVLLDEFNLEMLRQGVAMNAGRARLEASGSITLDNIRDVAETGVDAISIGALTKHLQALDLSMRLQDSD